MRAEVFLLGADGQRVGKETWNFVFVDEKGREIISWSKMEVFGNPYNGGRFGEDDGA